MGLGNHLGVIDSDYRGEWMAKFESLNKGDMNMFPYTVGERVAQCWIEKVLPIHFEKVDELSNTVITMLKIQLEEYSPDYMKVTQFTKNKIK